MGEAVQGRATFAFYSPTDEILLRGTKVVNPSAKAALRADFRNSCEKTQGLAGDLLSANPMVGGTVSLLLRLRLFHVDARLRRSIPVRIGTVINAGVRVDPDLDIGIALG